MEAKSNPNEIPRNTLKKRVLFIITQSEWGGAQKFLYELISRLDRNKYEILAATGTDGNGDFPRSLKNLGVPTHSLRFLKRKIDPYSDLRGLREIRALIGDFKPDTLFLTSSKAGALGALAAKRFPHLKVIYRIGGWQFNDPIPFPIKLLYIFAEKYTAKFKDFIIVNNKHDFEQAKKLKIRPKQKVELIYNGIDPYKLEFIDKEEAKIRIASFLKQKQRNLLQSKLIVGTIANFYKTKGLMYLIRAAKILYSKEKNRGIVFVIIGDGPERKNLDIEIKNLGLENKVFLLGMLPDASKYLSAFDIFVLSSVKEGFPWALIEAMSAKLPVIATKVGANPEIIENQKNGFLVEPGKPEEIALALESLASNENTRRELGIQAHQTTVMKFSQNKMIEKVESLL